MKCMDGDKHYFGVLVKDDFGRFFQQDGRLSTDTPNSRSCWDSREQDVNFLIGSDFQATIIFLRYPDILVL